VYGLPDGTMIPGTSSFVNHLMFLANDDLLSIETEFSIDLFEVRADDERTPGSR
jgi:hypothetical protein